VPAWFLTLAALGARFKHVNITIGSEALLWACVELVD